MTTFALDVNAHFYHFGSSRVQSGTLFLTTPQEQSVSYSYVDNLGPDQKYSLNSTVTLAVTLQSELLSGRLEWEEGGESFARQVSFTASEIYVTDVLWNGKRTTVAIWDAKHPGRESVEIVFTLDGDPLPDIDTLGRQGLWLNDQYGFWLSSISQYRTPEAANPYGPDKALDFSKIALWSTENDVVVNTAGSERTEIRTGIGNDDIETHHGPDLVDGGSGHDIVRLTGGDVDMLAGGVVNALGEVQILRNIETIIGTREAETFIAGTESMTFRGEGRSDLFRPGTGNSHFDGGDDIDTLSFETQTAAVFVDLNRGVARSTETGRDTFENIETILGGSADDFVVAYTGTDWTLNGGDGDDVLKFKGDAGGWLEGGGGNDKLVGSSYTDRLLGRTGDDVIFGLGGADTIRTGYGTDYAYGGQGADNMIGSEGRDFLRGNRDRDTLWGGDGDDDLEGGHGNDDLRGEAGNDVLEGGSGNDQLIGGAGNDYLYGGSGADVFKFGAGSFSVDRDPPGAIDRIQDFEDGIDLIDTGDRFMSSYNITDIGNNTVQIELIHDGDFILVRGISADQLTYEDFIFV